MTTATALLPMSDSALFVPAPDRDKFWQKVLGYSLGDPNAEPSFAFELKLARKMGWSPDFSELAILEFRKYLFIARMRLKDERIVPSVFVDDVWHFCLLYTQHYPVMCDDLFGEMFHHRMCSRAEDKAQLQAGFDRTLELYRANFGEPPEIIWFPTPPPYRLRHRLLAFLIRWLS
jgi:hypothetical protein